MASQASSNKEEESSLNSFIGHTPPSADILQTPDDSQALLFDISIPPSCVQTSSIADEHSEIFAVEAESNQETVDLLNKPFMEDNTASPFLSSVEGFPQPGIVLGAMSLDESPHSFQALTPRSEQGSPSSPSSNVTCQFLPNSDASLITSSPLTYADAVPNNHSPIISSSENCTSENLLPGSPSFAQCYANLTAWTTKLTTEGLGQIPSPSTEGMPIPLISLNQQPCVPATTAPVYSQPDRSKRPAPFLYGKIGPVPPSSDAVTATHVSSLGGNASRIRIPSISRSKLQPQPNKEHRFKKTADALQKSGLWEVAMKTGNLIKRNRELQKELEQFRADALLFLKSVIKNPQNRDFIKNVLNNALLANSTNHRKASVMNIVVSAAAAVATMKFKSSSCHSNHDSGISSSGSCGMQSDQSVSNFPCSNFGTISPGSTSEVPMDTK